MLKNYLIIALRNIKKNKVYSFLNIFGLASFTAETRTKEIGIRKVLGASVPSIIRLLNQEYVKKVFLAAGFIALVIALITVSFQTFRAAATNPADSLHYE